MGGVTWYIIILVVGSFASGWRSESLADSLYNTLIFIMVLNMYGRICLELY